MGRFDRIENWVGLAIERCFDQKLLAEYCGISVGHFQRKFKKKFGVTAGKWLLRKQCEYAKEFLLRGESTKVAAHEAFFKSLSHFCRSFKKVFGLRPQEFAQKMRE
jgi:AraC-like DNA-binding protein